MSDELEEATRLIDELVGLEHFEVVQMPTKSKDARLYGARALKSMTISYPPVVIADKKGISYLDRKKVPDAWAYAWEHGLEPPRRSNR